MSGYKEKLLADLNHTDPAVRLKTIRAFRKMKTVHSVEPMMKTALQDPVSYIRSEAVETLAVLNDPCAVGALAHILEKDETTYVRLKAAEALGRIGSVEASGPLLKALDDPDPDIVWKASEALGRRRETRGVDPLIHLLAHRDMYVQEKAAEALGNIGDRRAVEALRGVVNNEETRYSLDHQRFRRAAAAALEKLNKEGMQSGAPQGSREST